MFFLANVKQRLDHCVYDGASRRKFEFARVQHLAKIGSNPLPRLIQCLFARQLISKPFRFQATWTSHPQCGDFVEQTWVNVDAMYQSLYTLLANK